MHTLTFSTHSAILEPITGMGVLILPDPTVETDLSESNGNDQTADTAAARWYGGADQAEYSTIIRQLASIGWELPLNTDGHSAWLDAGCTDCCGRSMITLYALEPCESDPSLRTLVEASKRMQDQAAWTCCGVQALIESVCH